MKFDLCKKEIQQFSKAINDHVETFKERLGSGKTAKNPR